MLTDSIGKRSGKVKNIVERGAVKKFAEAIDDAHPIFICEKTGRQSRYRANIAPPTFPRVFDYGVIEGLDLPKKGLIHGEQLYHYERPLLVGEEIHCYQEVHDYYERNGKSGEMGFLQIKRYGEDSDGQLIFTEEQVVIITEAVRKGMKV
ncbi:MaoC family dehydratase N-terminal domain-containing protein [Halobacillus naozhouensis]|uniref:MaoC family dehydratase N-terminal domain-containing protein n=1 Tax=Halobacillus naozhouensis TaxID=554880 RepID=A0ABY8IVK1_9BACI|nr:MaoC family dehydratase N-terminal domain-containing protein [Halobacillus naozhouensis]WFT74005.1 MaoC family dehydratase N-terminal domain-containing protein [Halobacillus naozhouensis]